MGHQINGSDVRDFSDKGCTLPNRIMSGQRSRCRESSIQHFSKILNAIADICERTCCHKALFYVANNFL